MVLPAVNSLLCVVLLPRSRSPAGAATRAAARFLREAQHKSSGSREALNPARRQRRLCSQHGGGGGGGPGDGPRAGVRRGAALHQPLVHRRRRLWHGLVSVRAGLQARPHAITLCPLPVADLDAPARPFPRLGLAFRGAPDPWLLGLHSWSPGAGSRSRSRLRCCSAASSADSRLRLEGQPRLRPGLEDSGAWS